MNLLRLVVITIAVGLAWAGTLEEEGKKFIEDVNKKAQSLVQDLTAKRWAADTADKANKDKATKEHDEASKKLTEFNNGILAKIKSFPWKTFKDHSTMYMFLTVFYSYSIVLSGDKKAKYDKVVQDIQKIGNEALLKEYKSADNKLKLKPEDVNNKAAKDFKNVDEMNFYWKEYHDSLGKPVKDLFTQFVALKNENAHLLGYSNASVVVETIYEVPNFEKTMLELYKQIEPLYKELHAYIRYKLWVATGKKDEIVDPKGPIPASLLGSNWGVDASSLYDLLAPYPNTPLLDFSSKIKAKGYTSKKMAEIAESFYVSMGLSKLPAEFWTKSVFEKKGDMTCSASTYDFSNGKDYRMVFCAEPNANDFASMFSYVGDIEYAITSKHQPFLFQSQLSSAYIDAFDSVMQNFALSPDYLKSLGILDSSFKLDKELVINTLLSEALGLVFMTPWFYSLDVWRWSVYKGKITPQNYNCEYWKIRTSLQGIEPPVNRDENDFDAGVFTWFITGGNYVLYYISSFISYDITRGLCKTAGYYYPKTKPNNYLKFCDIHNSKEAGEKLKEMMTLGSSVPWYEAMEKVTGHNMLDGTALVEYFQPLFEWLQQENLKNKVTVGWNDGHNRCH